MSTHNLTGNNPADLLTHKLTGNNPADLLTHKLTGNNPADLLTHKLTVIKIDNSDKERKQNAKFIRQCIQNKDIEKIKNYVPENCYNKLYKEYVNYLKYSSNNS